MTSRDDIEATLHRLNAAENRRPHQTVEATSAAIDAVMAPDVEGWTNGAHVPDRAAERRTEQFIFGLLEDYHRTFDRVIIEPPLAAVGWTIEGTANGTPVHFQGTSSFELDAAGLIRRYWLHFDPAPLAAALA